MKYVDANKLKKLKEQGYDMFTTGGGYLQGVHSDDPYKGNIYTYIDIDQGIVMAGGADSYHHVGYKSIKGRVSSMDLELLVAKYDGKAYFVEKDLKDGTLFGAYRLRKNYIEDILDVFGEVRYMPHPKTDNFLSSLGLDYLI